MKVIEPDYEILTPISHINKLVELIPDLTMYGVDEDSRGYQELKLIEKAARNCYKSEDRITDDLSSAKKLTHELIERGHEAMLEHSSLTVKFICSRAVSHELVRHRLASFSQESQRYCNYSYGRFNSEITFVRPLWVNGEPGAVMYANDKPIMTASYAAIRWYESCKRAEDDYFDLLDFGLVPQEAREVLPNSTKTEVIVTANYREWRHILKLRTAPDAHPEMQRLMKPLLDELKVRIPVVFEDI